MAWPEAKNSVNCKAISKFPRPSRERVKCFPVRFLDSALSLEKQAPVSFLFSSPAKGEGAYLRTGLDPVSWTGSFLNGFGFCG